MEGQRKARGKGGPSKGTEYFNKYLINATGSTPNSLMCVFVYYSQFSCTIGIVFLELE